MSESNTYDQVPYESNPYPQSSPINLRTIGVLFGMNPPKLETARVLELGGAGGGNLMPFAYTYPKSHSIAVDLSKVQIDQGNSLLEKSGIKNLELKQGSITDVDASWGKFDYIISHGVLSWVPVFVQEKIIEICSTNLSDNGIAYISYNTLPGWNMVRSIREMMMYHASNFATDQDKVSQARLLLQFLKDSTEGSKTAYSDFLRNEADLLVNQPDHYIRHEHLEDDNKQFYFHEFMAMAAKNNLQYLGDAGISSMYVGNLPKKAAEKLSEIKDIVRIEQYMDYVTNRRFRSSLLCKNTTPINRSLNFNDIEKFYVNMKAAPEKPIADVNLEDSLETIKFFFNNNQELFISTSSPSMKSILYTLVENSNTMLSVKEILEKSAKKLKSSKPQDLMPDFLNNAMKLALSGYISISSEKPEYSTKLGKKPKVSELVRAQAEFTATFWVSTQKHERLPISLFDKVALRYLDGKNSFEDVKLKVFDHIKKGDLTLSKGETKLEKDEEINQQLDLIFKDFAVRLENSALLVE